MKWELGVENRTGWSTPKPDVNSLISTLEMQVDILKEIRDTGLIFEGDGHCDGFPVHKFTTEDPVLAERLHMYPDGSTIKMEDEGEDEEEAA